MPTATMTRPTSVFAKQAEQVYPHRWRAKFLMDDIVGGIPSSGKIMEGWLKSKIEAKDDEIKKLLAKTMIERGTTDIDDSAEAAALASVNGFKRDENGLYVESRQAKAMVKEAANIAWPKRQDWGPSRKGTRSYFAEHVFINPDRIYLGRMEADTIEERTVHTWRGNAISLEEICTDVELEMEFISDHEIAEKDWATIMVTAERNGLGAVRSQGHGTFSVIEWEKL